MKVLVALLSLIALSLPLHAAEKSKKKPAKASAPVKATAPVKEVKPWTPTAFEISGGRLPADYAGLDIVNFMEMFRSKLTTMTKGEFETTEAYQQRIADKDAILAPILRNELYAFRVKTDLVYDADKQSYEFLGHGNKLECRSAGYGNAEDGWATCEVGPIKRERTSYEGSNAYGTTVTVSRMRGEDFSVAVKKDTAAFQSLFESRDPSYIYRKTYSFKPPLDVPLDKARELKGMELGMLIVGNVSDAITVKGPGENLNATIDSPYDLYIEEIGIPFEYKKVVFYVVKTGEILKLIEL